MIIKGVLLFFLCVSVYNILLHKNGIQNSFAWIILAFIFGYRTIEPVSGLKLHPIEIMLYATIFRILLFNSIRYYKMPNSILFISLVFVLYFIIDVFTRYNPIALLEFKNAILLTGIFFISLHIQYNKTYLISILKLYLFSVTMISILGICEFLFPTLISSIFEYQNQDSSIYNDQIFYRVAFLFWGSHLAANLIPPAFPILLLLKAEGSELLKNNYSMTLIIIINLFAIYLSGNRISWLILTIYLVLTLFVYGNKIIPYMKTYAVIITIGFVLYIYSQPVEGRYISTFKALSGQIDERYDSSGAARMGRIKIALNSIINHPIGTGWGSQGWVHSDILQIASSVGILAGFILLFGPILLLIKLYDVYRKAPPIDQTCLFVCVGLLIYTIISLILNGNILKVQTGAPLFVAWAISNAYFNYYRSNKSFRMSG